MGRIGHRKVIFFENQKKRGGFKDKVITIYLTSVAINDNFLENMMGQDDDPWNDEIDERTENDRLWKVWPQRNFSIYVF